MNNLQISDFFKEMYTVVGRHELINYSKAVSDGLVVIYANRMYGAEHWTVAVEIHQCVNWETESWQMAVHALELQTDESLIAFVKDFETCHYDMYFPIDRKCESKCAYNNQGVCKYGAVFGKAPQINDMTSECSSIWPA